VEAYSSLGIWRSSHKISEDGHQHSVNHSQTSYLNDPDLEMKITQPVLKIKKVRFQS